MGARTHREFRELSDRLDIIHFVLYASIAIRNEACECFM
jgi:hypothetical protein